MLMQKLTEHIKIILNPSVMKVLSVRTFIPKCNKGCIVIISTESGNMPTTKYDQ